jgi:capsular exopolysaccharide synthesis family protein
VDSPTVFLSYSRADRDWKDRLTGHLGFLVKQRLIDLWHDGRIVAGADWFKEIEHSISTAKVAILLISKSFLSSEFILREEVPRLLMRRSEDGLRVFPILIKPCDWEAVPWLREMQVMTLNGLALSSGRQFQRESALTAIAQQIRATLEQVVESPQSEGTPAMGELVRVRSDLAVATETAPIEITINRDFSSYSESDQRELFAAITTMLNITGDIRVIRRRPGSVKMTLELMPEQSEQLYWAIKRGDLAMYDVVDAEFLPASVRSPRPANPIPVVPTTTLQVGPRRQRWTMKLLWNAVRRHWRLILPCWLVLTLALIALSYPWVDPIHRASVMAILPGAVLVTLVMLAAIVEAGSGRLSEAGEVVSDLGLGLLGILPALTTPRIGGSLSQRARADRQRSWLIESIDTTRVLLMHISRTQSIQVVMITSAVGSEGKTSLSGQLAASLARAGSKTLLIDCDLRKPALHRLFDMTLEPGMCEILRGEFEPFEAIHQTSAEFDFIAAGRCDSMALRTLSQDVVRRIFDTLAAGYDFIIVDSSPILPVADGLLIGRQVDAVLISTMRDVSRLPLVQRAYERLAVMGIPVLGAVFNGAADSYSAAYGYYGYTKYSKSGDMD